MVVGSPFGFPSVGSDPITAYIMLGCKLRVLGTTDKFPKFPKPFTIPIAADRLAGGLGTALDTHTRVRANPVEKNFRHVQGRQLYSQLTGISRGHQEHSHISTANRHSRRANDISKDNTPPPDIEMEETFTCTI